MENLFVWKYKRVNTKKAVKKEIREALKLTTEKGSFFGACYEREWSKNAERKKSMAHLEQFGCRQPCYELPCAKVVKNGQNRRILFLVTFGMMTSLKSSSHIRLNCVSLSPSLDVSRYVS